MKAYHFLVFYVTRVRVSVKVMLNMYLLCKFKQGTGEIRTALETEVGNNQNYKYIYVVYFHK